HYAGKTGVLRGRGSNTLVDRAGSFLDRKASTALRGSCCFVAGTVVWTASGQVPIEHVQAGHLVLSKHHETGEVGWYPVIDTIEIPASALLVLTLEHESGEVETVETTDEHPFRVGGAWARADTLVPGTTIETMHGTARVTALAYGSQRQTVYNITVRGAHTYLVGDDKVWVHNCTPKLRLPGPIRPKSTSRLVLVDVETGTVITGKRSEALHAQIFNRVGGDPDGYVGGLVRFDDRGLISSGEIMSGTFPGSADSALQAQSLLNMLRGQ
ncbi:MAG: polymorphic toxin-type HINT domain-containing protein, partial [Planctomycetota bacterium]